MSQIILACDDYYEEYHQLPIGSKHKEDTTLLTNGTKATALMHTLVGLKGTALKSTKAKSFFNFKASKGRKDGLLRTEDTAELYDPWGNPYYVLLDYDLDGELRDPHNGEIVKERKALVWSLGPDGQSGTKKTNKDNIYSWSR